MKPSISSKLRFAAYRRSRAGTADASSGNRSAILDGDDPENAPRPAKPQRRRFLRLYIRWLWPFRWALAGLLGLALLGALLDMAWPLALRSIINHLTGSAAGATGSADDAHAKLRSLNILGGAILALLIFQQIVETARTYRTAALNAKVTFRLRKKLFSSLINLSLGELGEMKSGTIVSRLSSDVESISGLVQMAIISPLVALVRVILTATILLVLSWQLALAALVIIPPMIALSLFYLRRVRPIYRSVQGDRSDVDGRVNETFGGIRVVRAFRRETREERGYAVGNHAIIRKNLWLERLKLVLHAGWGFLIPLTSLLIVWVGGYLSLQGRLDVGTIFAFMLYSSLLMQPVWAIVASVSQTQKALAAMERVFEAMERQPDKPDRPDAIDAPPVVAELCFEQANFEYRPGMRVIEDFTLTVPGGSVVAIVGPSGAGKTTLTDMIARFHDPSSGAIKLNGIDLRQFRLASYRGLLAVVQQETFLFDGTVRENISYGRRNATDEEVRAAAHRANAHEFIERLAEGYDTLIGERGFKLSGGQRQRLSIARAMLANPQILILDEATSNLDTESEQLIQAALDDLLRSRTTFVIAHRLSTITNADIIVAMESGKIRESGTHEELMARRGFYFEMVERQRSAMSESETALRG